MHRLRWLVLLVLLGIASPAFAFPWGWYARQAFDRLAGDSGVADSGAADVGFPFNESVFGYSNAAIGIEGTGCPGFDGGVQGWPILAGGGDGGELAFGYPGDGGTHTCNVSTGALVGAGGLGARFVNRAATLVEGSAGNCWRNASSNAPAIADGADIWCRSVFQIADNTATRYWWGYGSTSTNFIAMQLFSNERLNFNSQTTAATALSSNSSVLVAATNYFVDTYTHGASPTNPLTDWYVNGTATLGVEAATDLAGWAAGLGLAIGGRGGTACATTAGTTSPPDITFIASYCWFGADAATFTGEAFHDADCTRTGICP